MFKQPVRVFCFAAIVIGLLAVEVFVMSQYRADPVTIFWVVVTTSVLGCLLVACADPNFSLGYVFAFSVLAWWVIAGLAFAAFHYWRVAGICFLAGVAGVGVVYGIYKLRSWMNSRREYSRPVIFITRPD